MPDLYPTSDSVGTDEAYSSASTKRYYRLKILDLGTANIEAIIYPLEMHSLAPSGTPSRYKFGEVIYSQKGNTRKSC
jgi:hypothetical protein